MRKHLLLILSAAVAGAAVLASPAIAQQKTVKACEAEWRANRAANQAAGVTQKAYVEKCRAGTAAATPAPAPAAKPAAPPSTAAKPAKPGKTVKACEDEWRANKAANQAAGVTQKAYVEKCRAGESVAQPAPTAAPAPAPKTQPRTTPPAPSRPSQPSATAPAAPPAQAPTPAPAAGQPAGANQYASDTQAKARCPSDTVVWVNLDSKVYHYSSYRNYGKTKSGAYMCEKDTAAAGFRAAKNEKRP